MSTVDFDKFVELVERSQLVDATRLRELLEREFSKPAARTSQQLATKLVEEQLLTKWQADNLLKGKHKGFHLGRYRLLDQLGRGGMSTVYLAEHQLMKRRAAIKVLPRQRVDDRSYLGRFLREAQATAALDHPNIVRVYDIAAEGKIHFIAMEYVEGKDLQTLVADEGPLDFYRAADYIAQAAVGLQHAHDQGLTHRDVKPANLMANPEGIVKVLDLGLARFHNESMPSLTIAHEDNVLGTVDYLAPEQAEDSHGVDSRADIYGLGCTLYFLLTGHPPFPTGTLAQRVMKHQKQQAPPIQRDRPDVPEVLEDICRRMMIKNPEQRVQTALEVAEELVAWLDRNGVRSQAAGPLAALSEQTHRRAVPAPPPIGGFVAGFATPRHDPVRDDVIPPTAESADEHLELVPIDDTPATRTERPAASPPATSPDPVTATPRQETSAEPQDEAWEQRVSILEQELAPIEASSHDSLLSGERIKIERRLRPSDSTIQSAGIPGWVWWVSGAVVVGLLLIVALIVASAR